MIRVGFDVGGTNVAVGLVDENNSIVGKAWTPTRKELGLETIISDMKNCLDNALTFSGYDLSDCTGIGVGTPGTCDKEKGIARYVHHLGLDSIPYAEMLSARTGLKVFIENDANCAALGEAVAGAAKEYSSSLFVTLGTGVGGGFIADGKIFGGYNCLGGEFGHTCIAVDGVKCACGETGCWDAYASAAALAKQAKEAAAEFGNSLLNSFETIDAKTVFDCAEKGDATAKNVLDKYYKYVGIGIVNFINSIYPEAIIIGGGVSEAGDALINGVREYVYKHIFIKDTALAPKIIKAQLGNNAGIIGAAALCAE